MATSSIKFILPCFMPFSTFDRVEYFQLTLTMILKENTAYLTLHPECKDQRLIISLIILYSTVYDKESKTASVSFAPRTERDANSHSVGWFEIFIHRKVRARPRAPSARPFNNSAIGILSGPIRTHSVSPRVFV